MKLFKKKSPAELSPGLVSMQRSCGDGFSLPAAVHPCEKELYDRLRSAVPIIDAAIMKIIRLTGGSRGFTSLLCQNQIEPGLKMNISFNSLMDDYYTLPYVEHEYNSDDSSYIYVRPNTSMWDAAANLSYKLLGTYPYIKGTNRVMISPAAAQTVFDLSSMEKISEGTELLYSRLASDYHMADMGGNYGTFDLNDPDVSAKRIVRHKYFDLDMRFLYSPQQALVYRDKFDSRGIVRRYCSYSGYCGEDLCDLVSFGSITAQPVGSVTIRGSSRGIITETGVYTDKFPHSLT